MAYGYAFDVERDESTRALMGFDLVTASTSDKENRGLPTFREN